MEIPDLSDGVRIYKNLRSSIKPVNEIYQVLYVRNTAHNKNHEQKMETLSLTNPKPLQYIIHENIFVRKNTEEPAEYYTSCKQIINR